MEWQKAISLEIIMEIIVNMELVMAKQIITITTIISLSIRIQIIHNIISKIVLMKLSQLGIGWLQCLFWLCLV